MYRVASRASRGSHLLPCVSHAPAEAKCWRGHRLPGERTALLEEVKPACCAVCLRWMWASWVRVAVTKTLLPPRCRGFSCLSSRQRRHQNATQRNTTEQSERKLGTITQGLRRGSHASQRAGAAGRLHRRPSGLHAPPSLYSTISPYSEKYVQTGVRTSSGLVASSQMRQVEYGGAYRCRVEAGPSEGLPTLCKPRESAVTVPRARHQHPRPGQQLRQRCQQGISQQGSATPQLAAANHAHSSREVGSTVLIAHRA